MVGRALAANAQKAAHSRQLIFTLCCRLCEWARESLKVLKTRAGRADGDRGLRLGFRDRLGQVFKSALCKTAAGKFLALRWVELERLAIRCDQAVGDGVKIQAAGKGHSGDHFGACEHVHRLGVAVVTATEVTVERSEDDVVLTLELATVPLTNARTARVGENTATSVGKCLGNSITLDRSADLLGARRDVEAGLDLHTAGCRLARETGTASHVGVAAVRARANERGAQLQRVIARL